MQVKTKKGDIINVTLLKANGDIFGNDMGTGKNVQIKKDDILVILNETLSFVEIVIGFIAKLKIWFGK